MTPPEKTTEEELKDKFILVNDYSETEYRLHCYKVFLKEDEDAEDWLSENTSHHLSNCDWSLHDSRPFIFFHD